MPAAPAPARPPAAPVPPVATPTPALARPSGRRGRLTFSQQRLVEPLILEQDVLDPTWNKFKTVMVFVGGILVFVVFGFLMFALGVVGGSNLPPSTAPASYPAPAPPAVSTPVAPAAVQSQPDSQPQWNSYADCQRHYVLTLLQDPEGACDSFK